MRSHRVSNEIENLKAKYRFTNTEKVRVNGL